MTLTKDDCFKFFDIWYLNDTEFVSKEDSSNWIKTRITGKITKQMLDKQRNLEINGNDMM